MSADPYRWPLDVHAWWEMKRENDALKAQVAELEAQVRWMGGDTGVQG